MEEQPIVAARASVMIYDDDNKKWIHSGTSTGVSKVHIYQHITQNTFRVVGRKLHDHELVINCSIIKGLKYNKATPTFHQWRDTKQVYGLNFSTKEDAENFANSMFKVLEILNQQQHNLMINGNGLNNQQLNQNIINTQQLQHQPVYAHLNDTTQLIKQQYQAPPEYSEIVHTNNRTNGWTTQQQASQLSQPNSLDLNDWRQQQIQNDLNQLNLNTQLNGQQTVQIMNQMQPIYGHHRNSLTNQNAQLQQNAQLITQHQQLIQAQQQIQHISNGLGQNSVSNNLNTSMQPTPNNQTIQQQQVLNSTQIQSTPQQQQLINQQQQQQTSNQLNNNLTQQSAIPNPPSITQPQPPQLPQQQNATPNIPQPPPPPPMPPSNLSSNSTTSSNSTINSSIINKQTGNSLASALASAKLKKTPNKDDQKEKPNSGGGMASMLDEMTKTLARRRAQAESNNHTNGNCNGKDENDSISSRNSLKNGWDNKNKTSPNKDNDSNSRLRTGSADSSHIEFDVEKLKQDIIMEMKKEMNKIKLEIIEAIKTELSRN